MKRKIRKKSFIAASVVIAMLAASPFFINYYVKSSVSNYFMDATSLGQKNADCILILGAGLKPDGTPNHMLQDRLDKGIELYNAGIAPKLLLSGDNGQVAYDEVNAMKEYALNQGVPPEDLFLDHAGFSTYESIYQARDVFLVKKVIIVTQSYHLYRALYIAKGLGMESYGAASDPHSYSGQNYREIREFLAICKDFFKTGLKIEPTYLGEPIPITSSGTASHD